MASVLGTAFEVYHETLADLYAFSIPHPIELLHNRTAASGAVAALRDDVGDDALEIARKPMDILHPTMFMGLTEGGTHSTSE